MERTHRFTPALVSRAATLLPGFRRTSWLWRGVWKFIALVLLVPSTHAAVRFDVFLGYDGVVPEASWFPVTFEVFNDGPTFNAMVELSAGGFADSQTRRMAVELPTGTLKRFVIPVFSSGRNVYEWNARLLDERGKVRAEFKGLRPRKQNVWQIPLLGALSRSLPTLPEVKNNQAELQPVVARLQSTLFPDNPVALEGLNALYLGSDEALNNTFNVGQVNAVLAWLFNGGHLIVGVEQITHINGIPWLRKLLPIDLTDMAIVETHPELHAWVRSLQRLEGPPYDFASLAAPSGIDSVTNPLEKLTPHEAFERAPLQVATGALRDATVVVQSGERPLVVTSKRGRGRVTVVLFSPELEPFRSWTIRPYFWAKMIDVPADLLASARVNRYSGYSIDGVFGSMIDSKQIRKLPVGWLLCLLVGYLLVIGPLDHFWLKRIGKQMLTWVTFPIYVALFSGLIYLIGYKLRAGELEWNELHLVDITPLPAGLQTDVRGRTYVSVYSPANSTYSVASDQAIAAFRGEFLGNYRHGQEASEAEVLQVANSFRAEISVPVWTSQLFVSDWLRQEEAQLGFSLTNTAAGYEVLVNNSLDQTLSSARFVWQDQVHWLGELPAGKISKFKLGTSSKSLQDFVQTHGHMFVDAANYRQQAFGGDDQGKIADLSASSMAACFTSQLETERQFRNFITPPGLDLSSLVARGDAVLLGWGANYSPVNPLNQFPARRSSHNTLFRVVQPQPLNRRP